MTPLNSSVALFTSDSTSNKTIHGIDRAKILKAQIIIAHRYPKLPLDKLHQLQRKERVYQTRTEDVLLPISSHECVIPNVTREEAI